MRGQIRGVMASAALALMVPVAADARTDLLFILDGSNSMWGQIEGTTKIDVAREALGRLLSDLPSDTAVGLMAYGHRRPGDCADVELIAPVGALGADEIARKVRELTPRGKTPLAGSLAAARDAFPEDGAAHEVVLISDGVETCGGDPCAVAGELARSGVRARVHVVGFDLGPEERAALECIAREGRGRYFTADTVAALSTAISGAVEEATLPSARQAAPRPVQVAETAGWVEEFEGDGLGPEWKVLGLDEENLLVDEGQLIIVNAWGNYWGAKDVRFENQVMRVDPLPKGDWDISIDFTAELQTGADQLQLGLYKDGENYLRSSFWIETGSMCSDAAVQIDKRVKGKNTKAVTKFYSCANPDKVVDQVITPVAEQGATLTLSKRGRKYSARLDIGKRSWSTDKLTLLRAPRQLMFGPSMFEARDSESIWSIERIRFTPQ